MDRIFKLPETTNIGGNEKSLKLRDILSRLEDIYCRSIGVEYMHISDVDQCTWIREKMETPGVLQLNVDSKRLILARLTRAWGLEAFLAKKWSSEKR